MTVYLIVSLFLVSSLFEHQIFVDVEKGSVTNLSSSTERGSVEISRRGSSASCERMPNAASKEEKNDEERSQHAEMADISLERAVNMDAQPVMTDVSDLSYAQNAFVLSAPAEVYSSNFPIRFT